MKGYCKFCDMCIIPYIDKDDLSKNVSETMKEVSVKQQDEEEIKKIPGDIYVDDIYEKTGNNKKEKLRRICQVAGMRNNKSFQVKQRQDIQQN